MSEYIEENYRLGIYLRLSKDEAKDKIKHICLCNLYKKYPKQHICSSHQLDYDELEKVVLDNLKDMCQKYLKRDYLEKLLQKMIIL